MDTSSPAYISLVAQTLWSELTVLNDKMMKSSGGAQENFIYIKQLLVTIANLVDFELQIRRIYVEHPELSAEYKGLKPKYDFAKYLRNYFGGHLNPAAIAKALEWKPELKLIPKNYGHEKSAFISMCILETAINTYVSEGGEHQIFDSETDLMFPSDVDRFMIFLTEINHGATNFLWNLITALDDKLPAPPEFQEANALFVQAGKTDFQRLTQKSVPNFNHQQVSPDESSEIAALVDRVVAGEITLTSLPSILKKKG